MAGVQPAYAIEIHIWPRFGEISATSHGTSKRRSVGPRESGLWRETEGGRSVRVILHPSRTSRDSFRHEREEQRGGEWEPKSELAVGRPPNIWELKVGVS